MRYLKQRFVCIQKKFIQKSHGIFTFIEIKVVYMTKIKFCFSTFSTALKQNYATVQENHLKQAEKTEYIYLYHWRSDLISIRRITGQKWAFFSLKNRRTFRMAQCTIWIVFHRKLYDLRIQNWFSNLFWYWYFLINVL